MSARVAKLDETGAWLLLRILFLWQCALSVNSKGQSKQTKGIIWREACHQKDFFLGGPMMTNSHQGIRPKVL